MENVKSLVEHYMSKYNKIKSKMDEVQQDRRQIEARLKTAEKNYDIDEMEECQDKLRKREHLYSKLEKDLNELKEKAHATKPGLNKERTEALKQDGEAIRQANQPKVDEILRLREELKEKEEEIKAINQQNRAEFNQELGKLKVFNTKQNRLVEPYYEMHYIDIQVPKDK